MVGQLGFPAKRVASHRVSRVNRVRSADPPPSCMRPIFPAFLYRRTNARGPSPDTAGRGPGCGGAKVQARLRELQLREREPLDFEPPDFEAPDFEPPDFEPPDLLDDDPDLDDDPPDLLD